MKTLELGRSAGMSFEEALDFAVQDNKSLISRALAKATSEAGKLGKEWTLTYRQPGLLYT